MSFSRIQIAYLSIQIIARVIKGKSGRTDWLVKNILTKKGWFTPPFLTEENLLKVLHKLYSEVECHTDGSIAYFKCMK